MGRQGRARGRSRPAAQGRQAAAALAPGGDRPHAAPAFAERARRQGRLHRGGGRDLRRLSARPRGRRCPRAPDQRARAGRPTGTTRRPGCPRTARPSPTPTATTCGSWPRRAARRASWSRAAARCGSTTRASSSRSNATTRPAWRWSTSPTRGRDASRSHTASSTRTATRASPPSPPTATEVAYTFTPRADLNRTSEIRVAALDGGAVRAVTGTPHMHDNSPAWSPDGDDDRVRVRAQRLLRAAPRRRRGAPADERGRRPPRARLAPRRHAPGRRPRAAQPLRPGRRRRGERRGRGRRRGRRLGQPVLDAGRRDRRHLRGPRDAARSCAPRRRPQLHAPAPRATRRAPYAALEEVAFALLRRAGDPGLPAPPAERRRRASGARRRLSARRPDRRLHRRLGRPRPVLRRQGLRVAGDQLPRLHRLRARLRARSTTACGASTTPRTASPPPTTCAALDWVDGERLAIFGASYGSYMALRVGDRRPRAPLPLRGGQVRRLRHPHLLGAGRPRRRAGPRADDGPPVDRPRGLSRRLALPPPGRTCRRRCSSPTASATSA